MKKITLFILLLVLSYACAFAQSRNTKVFTIFTSSGCGCTGSGGAPKSFTTNEEVLSKLHKASNGMDFIEFEGTITEAYNEVQSNKRDPERIVI